jgi:hypothetical protein
VRDVRLAIQAMSADAWRGLGEATPWSVPSR